MNVSKVWMNGKLTSFDKSGVSLFTNALHYGTGVFEGIRAYNTANGPAVFRLMDHLDRFFIGAQILGMNLAYSKNDLVDAVSGVILANNFTECYIRPLAVYSTGSMSLDVRKASIDVTVTAWPWDSHLGNESLSNGITVKTASLLRNSPRSLPSSVKLTGAYANAVLAKSEALRLGYDEALLLDDFGHVSEGSGENIFFVRNKKLFAVDSCSMLKGITRDTVMALALNSGYSVEEVKTTVDQLFQMDEIFMTGTGCEVVPVKKLDHMTIGRGHPGSVTRHMQKLYSDAVHGKLPDYSEWLTYSENKILAV